ncbi:hypothetical protein [Croceimicrobium hydrocarbonivorans]|uniref:Uncharacterized protein n=1 Tax=Croceimicrobium hydrocarbonivorans TaxID=2761580 RepID=A0A7H0VDZ4_9FLAO|nr:hypothetical protein [Croceimicrobium hydrocarbonivorans]QNR23942.1 hypothetical protein H4K34_16440 [Croceimicrobium hydrocarbonivorans]
MQKQIWDFGKDSLSIISYGDLASDELDKILQRHIAYHLRGNKLILDADTILVDQREDTLILVLNRNSMLDSMVYFKLQSQKLNPSIKHKDFLGTWIISNSYNQDTLSFINDSILLYNGIYHREKPVNAWDIIDYKGVQMLWIQNPQDPLLQISKNANGQLLFIYPPLPTDTLRMETVDSVSIHSRIWGNWISPYTNEERIEGFPSPPFPLADNDSLTIRKLRFERDSVIFFKGKKVEKISYDLSSDGRRIYFPDRLYSKDGTWKIISLDDKALHFETHLIPNQFDPNFKRLSFYRMKNDSI